MLPKGRWVVFALCATCFAPLVFGEIHETRTYHGKKVQCIHYGFVAPNDRNCGTQGYTRVFIGTVVSAVDISDTDKRLELIPDDAFVGDKSELTVTVNLACLPEEEVEIMAGDRWLFFLRPKRYWDGKTPFIKTDGLEVPFDSPSKPVSEAEDDIALLRHLAGLTDKGILTGSVVRIGPTIDALNPTAVPNHRVIAKSVQSGSEYTAFTNMNGRFELELPPGSYDVTASTEQGLRDADPLVATPIELEHGFKGNAHIRARGCTEMAFRLLVDGKLAGRVTKGDGRPASFAKVAIVPVSPVRAPFTVDADENGYFEVTGRQPGKYVVGVGLLAPFDSAEWQSRVYYPGVRTREQAKVIELDVGEWRTDIDFSLPSTSK